MFFDKLKVYELEEWANDKLGEIVQEKASYPAAGLGKYEVEANGFVPISQNEFFIKSNMTGGLLFLKHRCSKRVIEKSELTENVAKEFALELDMDPDFRPSKKELQIAKERVLMQMLPNANIKTEYTYVVTDRNSLYISSTTTSKCERIISDIRQAIGSLSVLPVVPKADTVQHFTRAVLEPEVTNNDVTIVALEKFKLQNTSGQKITIDDLDLINYDTLKEVTESNRCFEGTFLIHEIDDKDHAYIVKLDADLNIKKLKCSDTALAEIEEMTIIADFLLALKCYEMIVKYFGKEEGWS